MDTKKEKGIGDNLKRGTIEIVLLSMLEIEDQYGYQLSQTLATLSEGKYKLNEATMYPTLYRLETRGYLEAYKKNVVGNRFRVYYHLTESGAEYLNIVRDQYLLFCDMMETFLNNLSLKKEVEISS